MAVNCRASNAFLPRGYVCASRLCCSPVVPMPSADGPRYDGFARCRVRRFRRDRRLRRAAGVVSSVCGALATFRATCLVLIGMRFAFALSANCWRVRVRTSSRRGTTPTWHNNENAEYETTYGHARGRRRRDDARLLSRHRLSALCRCARHVPRASAAAFLVRAFVRVARRAARHASHHGRIERTAA